MVRVRNERLEQHFPTLAMVREFEEVEALNTDLESVEACAIVTGVNTHNDMLKATIKAVSKDATKLGIEVGMTGAEAIDLLR